MDTITDNECRYWQKEYVMCEIMKYRHMQSVNFDENDPLYYAGDIERATAIGLQIAFIKRDGSQLFPDPANPLSYYWIRDAFNKLLDQIPTE